MAKVKQDKAKGPRRSPSHMQEIQIPLALVTEPGPVRRNGQARGRVGAARQAAGQAGETARPRRSAPAPSARAAQRATTGPSRPAATTAAKGARGASKRGKGVASGGSAMASGAPGIAGKDSGAKSRVRGAARKPARGSRPVRGPEKRSTPVRTSGRVSPRGAAKKGGPKVGKHLERRAPERVVTVKPLDPFARCGPRTSVEHLIRVEERLDGESSVHLVFFDRHGWYCEHGKACRAVDDVRRHGKQLGLTF